jgi:hypothetical protein
MDRLCSLLSGARVVIGTVLDSIASSPPLSSMLAAVSTPQQATALYDMAAQIPQASTRALLQSNESIILDGMMPVPVSRGVSKSAFICAFKAEGPLLLPRVLKLLPSVTAAEKEARLWDALGKVATVAGTIALVPVTSVAVPRSTKYLSCGGTGGLLMPQYSCTLAQLPKGDLIVPCALNVVAVLGRTLSFIHDRGWMHGDVKPANIFVDTMGSMWLGDYGMSAPYSELSTFRGGTPAFQCEALQSDSPDFSPLRFDRVGLAISVLVMLGKLDVLQAPDWPGWALHTLLLAVSSVGDPTLRDTISSLIAH